MATHCKICSTELHDRRDKYCHPCEKCRKAELAVSGYLQETKYSCRRKYRSQDEMENEYETKHGTGHG